MVRNRTQTGPSFFPSATIANLFEEAILPINPGQAGSGYNSSDAWDYFHINSVDKDDEGNYLISARDACAVHKINGTDGSIIWRLNGNRSDFKMAKGTKFCFQHHARWISQEDGVEIISLYDNSAHGTEHNGGSEVHTAPTSSGKILKLNTNSWTADLVGAYFPPDGLLSKSQGSTQVLPGGNVVVGWGSEGAVTEFTSDGTAIFHAYMDSGALGNGVQNYRAFRYNWTGLPNEDPALVSLEGEDGTTVYVSWNGDTETALWRFYAEAEEFGNHQFLGQVKRASFETKLFVPNQRLKSVFAEAIDDSGKRLVSTATVVTEQEILPVGIKETAGLHYPKKDNEQQPVGKYSFWEKYGLLKLLRFGYPFASDL